jgi:hypothetical protein
LNNLRSLFGGTARDGQHKKKLKDWDLFLDDDDVGVPSGQVRFDDRGNAVWQAGRNSHLEQPAIELAEEQAPRNTLKTNGTGLKAGYNPYDSGMLKKPSSRRSRDLRALSQWIEASKRRPSDTDD